MRKSGGDLEITRKIKQTDYSSNSTIYYKPSIVNMTPIYQSKQSVETRNAGKRKASFIEELVEENEKKMKIIITEDASKSAMKSETVLNKPVNIKQENIDTKIKILNDCKLSLQQDQHGNL